MSSGSIVDPDCLPPIFSKTFNECTNDSENRAKSPLHVETIEPWNAWGRKCSPLYPWLQPYGRTGTVGYVRNLPARSISLRRLDYRKPRNWPFTPILEPRGVAGHLARPGSHEGTSPAPVRPGPSRVVGAMGVFGSVPGMGLVVHPPAQTAPVARRRSNAQPDRLELNDIHARAAKEAA
jgi:hypothetical protein